jgi:hypothetical protein
MIRALVIGNSHAAALIKGWDQIRDGYADKVDLSFFATWEPIYRQLGFQGLVFGAHAESDLPQHSRDRLVEMNGTAQVDLTGFDHVLHVGLLVPDADLIDTARRFDVDGLPEAGHPHRLSRPAFDALVDSLAQRPPVRALFQGPWAQLGSRLTVLRRPRAKDTVFDASQTAAAKQFGVAQDRIDAALTTQAASAGILFLPQPAATLSDKGLSDSRFADTAPRLMGDKTYTRPDLYHMNAAYGALCLKAWLDSMT